MDEPTSIPPIGPPVALHEAAERLARAADREEILDLLEDYGSQFFEFFAVLALRGDRVEVRRVVTDDEAASSQAQHFEFPLGQAGAFSEVYQSHQAQVVDLSNDTTSASIIQAFGRSAMQPALLLPIAVRGKVVIILYGDRGGHAFALKSFSKLMAFVAHVGNAIEMLILRNKLRGQQSSQRPERDQRETTSLRAVKNTPSVRSTPPLSKPPQAHSDRNDEVRVSEPAKRVATSGTAPAKAESVGPDKPSAFSSASGSLRESWRSRPQEKLGLPRSAPPVPFWDKEVRQRRQDAGRADKKNALLRSEEPTVVQPRQVVSNDSGARSRISDRVQSLVKELSSCSPEQVDATIAMALTEGSAVLPELVKRFPGELWFNRHQKSGHLARGRDVSAIARALVSFGSEAVPYVATLLDPKTDDESRFYAVLVASDLANKDLIEALGRLLFDQDLGIRNLVMEVLCKFRGVRELEAVLRPLRSVAQSAGEAPARRRIAVRALGELRDDRSVKLLVSLLGTDEPALMQTTQRSLALLTRHDFGTSKRRWATWLARHGKKNRVQWLIEALMQDEESLRSAAFDELRQLVKAGYGYDPSGPKKERKAAYRRFVAWYKERT